MPTGPELRPRWYEAGLRFECRPDCGVCCTCHEDYAYVYLTARDVISLADHFRLTRAEFREQFTARDDGHLVLRMDGPHCPFLSEARCAVYPARPLQCRTFPFWKENLRDARSWERLSFFCPGIGHGELMSAEAIARASRGR